MARRISACIVNWNTKNDLRTCLQTLRQKSLSQDELEIIVVDNGSADGSADLVRGEFPGVVLIANNANESYAKGTNQALARATGTHLLLLNPDVQITTDTLETLADALDAHPDAAAIAPRLVYPDGQTQASVRGFPDPLAVLWDILKLPRLLPASRTLGAYRQTFFDYDREQQAAQPMASCFLLTQRAYEIVGPMDERFPLYFNDADWCLRAHHAQMPIWYTPRAVALHEGGATTKRVRVAAVWESHRAMLRFYDKHYKKTTFGPLYALLTVLITLGAWARTGRWGQTLGRNGGETTPESLHRELERQK